MLDLNPVIWSLKAEVNRIKRAEKKMEALGGIHDQSVDIELMSVRKPAKRPKLNQSGSEVPTQGSS
jgi:hypothetical protein